MFSILKKKCKRFSTGTENTDTNYTKGCTILYKKNSLCPLPSLDVTDIGVFKLVVTRKHFRRNTTSSFSGVVITVLRGHVNIFH